MMYEKFHTFKLKYKNIEDIQIKMKKILFESLKFTTATMCILYYSDEKDIYKLENNQLIVSQDENRFFIQIKGNLTDEQGSLIWKEFEQYLEESGENITEVEEENQIDEHLEECIDIFINKLKYIQRTDVEKFLENFQKKYSRLPNIVEIDSIDTEYILTLNKKLLRQKQLVEAKKLKKAEKSDEPEKLSLGLDKEEDESINSLLRHVEKVLSEGLAGKKKDYEKKTEAGKAVQDDILEIKRPVGRRTCPKCENKSSPLIHELEDKTIILSIVPRIYAKKYQCRICNCEWREK